MWNSKTEDRSRTAGEYRERQDVGERWVSTVMAQLSEVTLRTGLFVFHSDQLNQELTFSMINQIVNTVWVRRYLPIVKLCYWSIKVTIDNILQVKKASQNVSSLYVSKCRK